VGRATAIAFARRGDAVALVARAEDALDAAARDVERAGGRALCCPCDVSDFAAVDAVAERVEHELGAIDVWVNAAMASVFGFSWDLDPADVRRVTEVTYLGFVHGTLAALRRMRPRDRGVIVQVGSALAYRAIPLQAAYCASKFAIRGFTDSVRCELLHERSGVRITMVQLPGLNTPQFDQVRNLLPKRPRPVAPVFQPEVAADGILWAAEHPRREVDVGGNTAVIIAANKLFPGLADRFLARTNVKGQLDDEPERPRDDYLYHPLPGDPGAHGRFDAEAKPRSLQLDLRKRKRPVLAGAVAASAAVLSAWAASR
jgi:short-subunit dehydrogenase